MIQVNYSAAPKPSSSAELNSNTPDRVDKKAAEGFWAQIDTILNKRTEEEADSEEKPDSKDPAKTEADLLPMVAGAVLIQEAAKEAPEIALPSAEDDWVNQEIISETIGVAESSADMQMTSPSSGFTADLRESLQTAQGIEVDAEELAANETVTESEPSVPVITASLASNEINGTAAAADVKDVPERKQDPAPLANSSAEVVPPVVDSTLTDKAVRQDSASLPKLEAVPAEPTIAENESHPLNDDQPPSDHRAFAGFAKAANAIRIVPESAENTNTQSNSENAARDFSSRTVPQIKSENSPALFNSEAVGAEGHAAVSTVISMNPALPTHEAAVTAPNRADAAAKPQADDFMFQLADRIQVQLRDGKSEIRVQLHPDNLGYLEIRAENSISGVVARIVAQSTTVKDFLEAHLPLLQQSFQDQGLKIDRIQVSVQDNGSSDSSASYSSQSGFAGSGNHEKSSNGRFSNSMAYQEQARPEETLPDQLAYLRKNPNARFYTVA